MKKLASLSVIAAVVVLAAQAIYHKHQNCRNGSFVSAVERQTLRDAPNSDLNGNGDVKDILSNANKNSSGVPAVPGKAVSRPGRGKAFANKSRLDCVIKVNGHKNTVSFAVAKLGQPDAELLSLGAKEEDGPILEGKDNQEINSMNDQGGDMRFDGKTLSLIGDGDGFSIIEIALFADTGYTRGWASESGSNNPHWHSTDVSCTVKSL